MLLNIKNCCKTTKDWIPVLTTTQYATDDIFILGLIAILDVKICINM